MIKKFLIAAPVLLALLVLIGYFIIKVAMWLAIVASVYMVTDLVYKLAKPRKAKVKEKPKKILSPYGFRKINISRSLDSIIERIG